MIYTLNKRSKLKLAVRIKKNLYISRLPVPDRYKNRVAFTLAEILITLTILGIVAALTIPPIVQNIQGIQFKIMWKESYSILQQAADRVLMGNSGSFKNLCSGASNEHDCFRNLFLPHLSYTKTCNSTGVLGDCFTNASGIKNLYGTSTDDWITERIYAASGIKLVNGIELGFVSLAADCSDDLAYGNINLPIKCGIIFIDTNGAKKPNTIGKDIFALFILADKVVLPNQFPNEDSFYTCRDYDGWCNNDYLLN